MLMQGEGQGAPAPMTDSFGRIVDYVRIALTEACNLRCTYCLREGAGEDAPSGGKLDKAELETIMRVLGGVGVRKIRFTGGEPLLRRELPELVAFAKRSAGIRNVKLTTNGVLLERRIRELLDAGLDGVNLSLDTLDAGRFSTITRREGFDKVRRALDLLLGMPEFPVKLNVLMLRGINQDELPAFVELTRESGITVRFMELQPFDDHQIWRTGRFMGAEMIREHLMRAFPGIEPATGTDTEHYSFRVPGYRGSVAIIPAYSRNFCSSCSRLRITADGRLVSCLYRDGSIPLRPLLAGESAEAELARTIAEAVRLKPQDGLKSRGGNSVQSMSQIGG